MAINGPIGEHRFLISDTRKHSLPRIQVWLILYRPLHLLGNLHVLPYSRLILPNECTSGTAYWPNPYFPYLRHRNWFSWWPRSDLLPGATCCASRCLPAPEWSLGIGHPLPPRLLLPLWRNRRVPASLPRRRSPAHSLRSKISILGLFSSRPLLPWDYPTETDFVFLILLQRVVSSCHRCQRYLLNASPLSASSFMWSIVIIVFLSLWTL